MSRLACSAMLLAAALLAGCATTPAALPLPAVDVPAGRETDPVGTAQADAADDPAIWRNPSDPSASWIVGTDKRAGIHVYGLDGHARSFVRLGEINNVDLRDGVRIGARDAILVGASNRNSLTQPNVVLLTLDGATGNLTLLADLVVPGASGEAYGYCLGRVGGEVRSYVVTKQGRVFEQAIDLTGPTPALRPLRSFGVATQPEGCVVDDRTGQLYLGEEDVGIWRFDLTATQPVAVAFATVGAEDDLVADVEGLALAPSGASGGFLVASSQGDNAYTLFDLPSGQRVGRYRIAGGAIDGTFDTDGIELMLGDFGPDFAEGLFVAQDGNNLPEAQNFKLLSWRAIREALGLAPLPR